MKKEYISPAVDELECVTEAEMLVGSGVGSSGDYSIDYGGIDTEGAKEAASRASSMMFLLGD
mgnify:CR=1 FL=1